MNTMSSMHLCVGSLVAIGDDTGEVVCLDGPRLSISMASGQARILTLDELSQLIANGTLFIFAAPPKLHRIQIVLRAIPGVTPKQLDNAAKLFSKLQPYITTETPPPQSDIQLRKEYFAYQEAEKLHGDGFIALIKRTDLRGNRVQKCDARTDDLVMRAYTELTKERRTVSIQKIHGSYGLICTAEGVTPLSLKYFRRHLRALLSDHARETARTGSKGGYSSEPLPISIDSFGPLRKGQYPGEHAQIDHCKVPTHLLCPQTMLLLGPPWLTRLFDTCTDRVLAQWIHFAEPSSVALAMVLRVCMKRHGRLPSYISADWGPEFQSAFFERVLARYHSSKIQNRKSSSRDNDEVERSFGVTATAFLDGLMGYIPKHEDPRRRGRDANPEAIAAWPADRFAHYADQYAYEIYDQETDPARGISRREYHSHLQEVFGQRKHVLYPFTPQLCVDFLPELPAPYTIDPRLGIRPQGMRYWSEAFLDPRTHRTKVRVKPDPYDASTVYAYVNEKWVPCRSKHAQIMGYWTASEWAVVYEAMQKLHRDFLIKSEADARRAAIFRAEMLSEEAALLAHRRAQADAILEQQAAANAARPPRAADPGPIEPVPHYDSQPFEVIS